MASSYKVRALELHDSFSIWSHSRIDRVLEFMARNGMNTLVFHENDIVDKLVYPGLLYGGSGDSKNSYRIYQEIYRKIYHLTPSPFVFVDEKLILRDLMRSIVEKAVRAGVRLYLQTKELWFSDLIFRTELVKNGFVCPSEPYWWEVYLPAKYAELLANLPQISGIVTSTGTRESRTSLAHHMCQCDRCRAISLGEWQRKVLMAIYEPLKQAGKQLVVRDFTYYANEQSGIRAGLTDLPDDVIISIKNTPQDFYPTFPPNALLGNVGDHEQWIEYEVMGEYFAFGVAPCSVVGDIRDRMRYGLSKGAAGFTARVDWEALPNHSVFDTCNLVNLYAIAHLGSDTELPLRDVYRRWLTDEHLVAEGLSGGQAQRCVDTVTALFERTWPIMAKTPYVHGFMFNNNSKVPVSISNGEFLSQEHHGIQKWFPDKAVLFVVNDENVRGFLEEKDQALAEIEDLCRDVGESNPGLSPRFYETLLHQFEFFRAYVEMWRLVARVFFLVKYLGQKGAAATLLPYQELVGSIRGNLADIEAFERRYENRLFPAYDYPGRCLISVERLRCFREDAERVFASIVGGSEV